MHLFNKTSLLSVIVVIQLMTQGCASTQSSDKKIASATMSNLLITEPMPINFKSEVTIARISALMGSSKLNDEQRAQLLYERGVLYDSVGLRTLSRFDFTHALQLKPDFIDAYNFLGIHFTQLQEYSQAYENFDAALDLLPEHEYAHLNRGIALYYGSRPELAAQDFQSYHYKKQNDPYRLLWLYLTEYQIDPLVAKAALKERSILVDDRLWAKQIIYLYLGLISQNQFVTNLTRNVSSHEALTERLCEAYFYLAKLNQILGDDVTAANLFKLALSTNVYEFVEHRYAKLELDLMRNSVAVSTQ